MRLSRRFKITCLNRVHKLRGSVALFVLAAGGEVGLVDCLLWEAERRAGEGGGGARGGREGVLRLLATVHVLFVSEQLLRRCNRTAGRVRNGIALWYRGELERVCGEGGNSGEGVMIKQNEGTDTGSRLRGRGDSSGVVGKLLSEGGFAGRRTA